jgi:hypothetical protein
VIPSRSVRRLTTRAPTVDCMRLHDFVRLKATDWVRLKADTPYRHWL